MSSHPRRRHARLDALADAIVAVLLRLNSEFASYVPPERQRPEVTLRPVWDPEWFPAGASRGPRAALTAIGGPLAKFAIRIVLYPDS